jgi:hypothetical protein
MTDQWSVPIESGSVDVVGTDGVWGKKEVAIYPEQLENIDPPTVDMLLWYVVS